MAPRRAAIRFIFVTIVLDMLALGLVIPVFPKLIEGLSHGDTAHAASIYGLFGTVWALMQFIFSPVLGTLSDRVGRRPVILISAAGLGLDYFLMALAPNLGWLFAGRVISGITAASIGAASAYIADVLPPAERARGFGMIGVAFGLGFVLGPAIGGLLGSADLRLPFWVAGGFSLLNAAYGAFVLPESLPKEKRGPVDWKKANPIGAFAMLRSHPGLLGLGLISFLGNLAHTALPSTFVLYAGYRYGWEERSLGLSLAAVGVCSAVVQGGLVGPLVKRFGERASLILGQCLGSLGFFVYGAASTGLLFFFGVPFMALWGIAGPSAQALMSKRVGPEEQGRLQGAASGIMGIASLIGPMLFTTVFAHGISDRAAFHLPGAAFFVASALLAASVATAFFVTRRDARPASPPEPS